MSRAFRTATAALSVVVVLLAAPAGAVRAEPPKPPAAPVQAKAPPAKPTSPQREAEDTIRRALSQPVSVDFVETPLKDVVAFLQDLSGVPILLDRRPLEEIGVTRDTPVTFSVSNVTLRSSLRLMLRDLEGRYVVHDEVLIITTRDESETPSMMITRLYPVSDIIACPGPDNEVGYDFDSLMDLITVSVRPESWGEIGNDVLPIDGGGARAFSIWQTDETHEEIASLLAALRSIARRAAEGKTPEPILYDRLWPEPAAYESIREALSRKVSLEFNEVPLEKIVDRVREISGINVHVDARGLEAVEVDIRSPVTIRVTDTPLKTALRKILAELDLTYVIWDEVVLITIPEEAETRMAVGIYPLGDLVGRLRESGWPTDECRFLEEMITSRICPRSWESTGGPGTIVPACLEQINALVVRQTLEAHEQIAELLGRLRRIVLQLEQDEADAAALLKELFPDTPPHRPAPEALSRKVSFDFEDAPLGEFADFISKKCGLKCRLDERPLRRTGIDPDTPVSIRVSGITLRSALSLTLREVDLTWTIVDGVLLITTHDQAEKYLTLEIYPVTDIVTFLDQDSETWGYYYPLIDLVTRKVAPSAWQSVHGWGTISGLTLGGAKFLVVRRTEPVHEEIAELLGELRGIARELEEEGANPVALLKELFSETPEHRPAPGALSKKVSFDFEDAPLGEVAEFISESCAIKCGLDERVLEDVGINSHTSVSIHVSGITLRSALNLVLRQFDLTWIVVDGALLITTRDEAENYLTLEIYAVGDLVTFRERNDELWDDYFCLLDVITREVAPASWEDVGGPGRIFCWTLGGAKLLVVQQTDRVHDEIAGLLQELRRLAAEAGDGQRPPLKPRYYDGYGRYYGSRAGMGIF